MEDNRLKKLRQMLAESSVDDETKDLLEELEANDAAPAVKEGEPDEANGESTEADFGVNSEEHDDVVEDKADELQEDAELSTNDAAPAVSEGEPDEADGESSEEDFGVDTESHDDVVEDAAEDLQEEEELGTNDAAPAVSEGEPDKADGESSEEDFGVDSEEHDDVVEDAAETLQAGEKAKKVLKAGTIGTVAGAGVGAVAGTAKAVHDNRKDVKRGKELIKKEKDDKKKEDELNKEKEETKAYKESKKTKHEDVEADSSKPVISEDEIVSEDSLDVEPAVVDAIEAGNDNGVAVAEPSDNTEVEITDVSVEPAESAVADETIPEDAVDTVAESVNNIFNDIFASLHEDELGTNDAAPAVSEGEPDEADGESSEEDFGVDSEEHDDVVEDAAEDLQESDFSDMELMEMLEEAEYEASIENVQLLREDPEIFNEFLGLGFAAAGKRQAKRYAKRDKLVSQNKDTTKIDNKIEKVDNKFNNEYGAHKKVQFANGFKKASEKIVNKANKEADAVKSVDENKAALTKGFNKVASTIEKTKNPVSVNESTEVYDVDKAIVQNATGESENGNNTIDKVEYAPNEACDKKECPCEACEEKKEACNEDVNYTSLEEAVALGADYFLADEKRVTKLTEQVAMTMASENGDMLFAEMVKSQAIVNRCYNALLEKYINDAQARVSSLLEELSTNDAAEAVKDGAPEEGSGESSEADFGVDTESHDDVVEDKADELQEDAELATNDAAPAVKEGEPDEGDGESSEEDFDIDSEEHDDVVEDVAKDLQEADFSRETIMGVLKESSQYDATESNVTAILESIRLGYGNEIPAEIITGLNESEEGQYKKAVKEKAKLENKKNKILAKEKTFTDAVKRDAYHNKVVKTVAELDAKIRVLDDKISQKEGLVVTGNDHTEDPSK